VTRLLYVCLLRLHPKDFRRRYAEEMLGIFDQESGVANRSGLLADAFVSVGRQHLLRREYRKRSSPSGRFPVSADGIPVFYVSRAGMPRVSALLNGSVASVVAFGAVALVIAHGGGTSGFIRLPRVVVSSSNAPLPRKKASISLGRPRKSDRARPAGESAEQPRLSVEQRWEEGTLPVVNDQLLASDADVAAPPARGQVTNLDGATTVYQVVPADVANKLAGDVAILFSELDANEDGVITKVEWDQENQEDASEPSGVCGLRQEW